MNIQEIIQSKGIDEVLHFTTNLGLTGILYSGKLLSRARLEQDKLLEFIFSPNAEFRKDREWLDFVSLSLSRINGPYFGSSGYWHRDEDIWWCILSYSPEILNHDDVHFTTTNNIYTSVKRGVGGEYLELMFENEIERWRGETIKRSTELDDNCPTCERAEILYPGEIDLTYLKKIYTINEDDADEVQGMLSGLNVSSIEVVVDNDKFKN